MLQQDLYFLWQNTLTGVLPHPIHRDESFAETLVMKKPLGEYAPGSLSAKDLLGLARWCRTSLSERP
jgi:cellulose biosynthesis protein BcsQ